MIEFRHRVEDLVKPRPDHENVPPTFSSKGVRFASHRRAVFTSMCCSLPDVKTMQLAMFARSAASKLDLECHVSSLLGTCMLRARVNGTDTGSMIGAVRG